MSKYLIFRSLTAAALTLVTICALSACGKSNTYGEGDESEFSLSSLQIIPSETDGADLPASGGVTQVFTVLREASAEPGFAPSGLDEDIFSKTVYERNSKIYDEYGIEIKEIVTDDILRYAKTEELSESTDYDMLVFSAAGSSSELMSGGYLCDLLTLPGFNASAKGYYTSAMSSLSLAGRVYLAAGDAVPSFIRSTSAVLIDTAMFSKIGSAEEVSLLAASGGFTYEAMQKYSKQYAALVGETDASFAISVAADDAYSLFLSSGGSFMLKDALSDMPISPEFGEDMSKIYKNICNLIGFDPDLSEAALAESLESTAEDTEIPDSTEKDSPLFRACDVSSFEMLRQEEAPFIILPMPKFSASDERYVCNVNLDTAALTALPAGGKNNENALSVMNLIYATSGNIAASIGGESTGFELVKGSTFGDLLSAFGYADIKGLMASSVSDKMPTSDFLPEAAKRSKAAVAALSIVAEKLVRG